LDVAITFLNGHSKVDFDVSLTRCGLTRGTTYL
jgi:hypothetical protein